MTQVLGWLIIAAVLAATGAVVLWPFYRLARSRFSHPRTALVLYIAGLLPFGVVLWFALPPVVSLVFHHPVP